MALVLSGTDNSVSSPAVQGGTGGTTTGIYYPASNVIGFANNSAESMRIDSSGNVGIGVTPSAWNTSNRAIDMYGIGSVSSFSNGAGAYELDIGTNVYNSSGGWKYKVSSYAVSLYQQQTGQHIWYTAPSGTAGNAITFTQSLAVGKGTTLVLEGGTSSSGTGIAFPATQSASSDANTLDDYEEGTWTPTLGGTSSITSTASYTKIGNTVKAYFDLTVVSIGTGSTTTVSGFPFSASGTNDAGCIAYYLSSATSVYWLSIQMNGSGALIVGTTSSSTNIVNGVSVFGNGTRIIGTVVYKTST